MLVVVLCVLVVVGPLVVLAAAGLSLWRTTRALGRAVGQAGEAVAVSSEELQQGLVELERSAPARPGPAAAAHRRDSAVLAARVDRARRRR